MKKQIEPLESISEIRSMMERSSRFLSLNGLSGVFAGIFALLGAYAAYSYRNHSILSGYYSREISVMNIGCTIANYIFFIADAGIVLLASVSVAFILSKSKARKSGHIFWDSVAKRLLINLLIPLVSGGMFCMILLLHGFVGLIAPTMLIFYGLALINASKYTYNDIRFLGLLEVAVGLIASIWIGFGLLFWAIGFGIAHIIYGVIMYYKYER